MTRGPARFADLVSAAVVRLEARRSRALVPLPQQTPPDEFDKFSGLGATFLAHLIAMRDRAPQTLKQSRGSTDEAITSYEQAAPHSRSKNGVASLAPSRSKNGVASLAYGNDTIPIKES